MPQERAYVGGRFALYIDGHDYNTTAFVRSVSGGLAKGNVITEGLGEDHLVIKHIGGTDLEPIEIDLGLGVSDGIIRWIKDSWSRKASRCNGAIVFADFSSTERWEQTFTNALITEVKFPDVDAGNPTPGFIKVTIQPEDCAFKPATSRTLPRGTLDPEQKLYSVNKFELDLGAGSPSAIKLGGLSVKQKIAKLFVGRGQHSRSRFPEIEPCGLEFGDLTVHVPLARAKFYTDWYKDVLMDGSNTEKNGSLTYLGPDGKRLMSIELQNVGIHALTSDAAELGKVAMASVSLNVESYRVKA